MVKQNSSKHIDNLEESIAMKTMDEETVKKQRSVLMVRKLFEAFENEYKESRQFHRPLEFLWSEFEDLKWMLDNTDVTHEAVEQYCEIFKTITPYDLKELFINGMVGGFCEEPDQKSLEKWKHLHDVLKPFIPKKNDG